MDENRLNGWMFEFTQDERNILRTALVTFARRPNADAFLDDVESFVQVAGEESSRIYGPVKKRVAAVNKAASELRAALEALTSDDREELQSFSLANIPDSINDVVPALDVLMAAATEIQKHIKPNQHARDGQAPARLLITLSGQSWAKHFGKMPSVSKGTSANYGIRVSPFVGVMQAVLGILGWPDSFDFVRNAFVDVEGDIRQSL